MTVRHITMDDLLKAGQWAQRALDSKTGEIKIDGTKRGFDMGVYDCGTSCCLAGAAAIEAEFSNRVINPKWKHTGGLPNASALAGIRLHYAIGDLATKYEQEWAEAEEEVLENGKDISHLRWKYELAEQLNYITNIMGFDYAEETSPRRLIEAVKEIKKICKQYNVKEPNFRVEATIAEVKNSVDC